MFSLDEIAKELNMSKQNEFLYSNSIQDKIRYFHRDRISVRATNEYMGDLGIT